MDRFQAGSSSDGRCCRAEINSPLVLVLVLSGRPSIELRSAHDQRGGLEPEDITMANYGSCSGHVSDRVVVAP